MSASQVGVTFLVTGIQLVGEELFGILPFLAVLFGILGGVETLGLVGLFIGPVVMVLLVTLWREAGEAHGEEDQSEGV